MKPGRHRFARPWAAALIAVAAWLVTTAQTQADPSWTELRAEYFPAHVKAIVFSTGNVLDARTSLCWGTWCVNFGPERPEARLSHLINIRLLECKNRVAGVKKCTMTLAMEEPHTCALHILKEGGRTSKLIAINCPMELRLE